MYAKIFWLAAIMIGLPTVAHAEKWRDRVGQDMFNQPSYKTQEAPRALPKDSIPTTGRLVTISKFDPRIDRFQNPVTNPTAADRAQGKFLFETYCFPCHGKTGMGDGPVAPKGMPAPPLINDMYRARSDAYIWATILQGGPLMPPHAEAIDRDEAWLVVNYLRSLQKQ